METETATPRPVGDRKRPGRRSAIAWAALIGALAIGWAPAGIPAETRPTIQEMIDHFVAKHCAAYGVDPDLVHAIMQQESSYRPLAVGPPTRHGRAKGLMQLMPTTQKRFSVNDPFSIDENIRGGVCYLRTLQDLFPGEVTKVVAAYYSGENAVVRTRGWVSRAVYNYVQQVGDRYQRIKHRKGPSAVGGRSYRQRSGKAAVD